MKYEIQHSTFVDGWVNTSTTEDSDGNVIPLVFDSREEAQAEIDSDLAHIADQIASGEREADHGYDPEEFRVREVTPVSNLPVSDPDAIMSRKTFDYADMENAFELGSLIDQNKIDNHAKATFEGSAGFRLGVIAATECFESAMPLDSNGDQIYDNFDWMLAIEYFAESLETHACTQAQSWASLNHGRNSQDTDRVGERQDQFETEVTLLAMGAIKKATWR
jgi:hypothetical protein